MPDATPEQITAFIERWEHSGAAERANYALFLSELCALPADAACAPAWIADIFHRSAQDSTTP